jgi:hypothetical protein
MNPGTNDDRRGEHESGEHESGEHESGEHESGEHDLSHIFADLVDIVRLDLNDIPSVVVVHPMTDASAAAAPPAATPVVVTGPDAEPDAAEPDAAEPDTLVRPYAVPESIRSHPRYGEHSGERERSGERSGDNDVWSDDVRDELLERIVHDYHHCTNAADSVAPALQRSICDETLARDFAQLLREQDVLRQEEHEHGPESALAAATRALQATLAARVDARMSEYCEHTRRARRHERACEELMRQMSVARCQICYDALVNTVLVPCGHLFCRRCLDRAPARPTCPYCTQPVRATQVLRRT